MKEEEILDPSEYYSKTLKEIDAQLKFPKEEDDDDLKKVIRLKKKEKHLKYVKNLKHEKIVLSLKKFEKEAKQKIEDKAKGISLMSAINKIISLPTVAKYKKEIKDNKKNNENHLIKLEKIWREQYIKEVKQKKKFSKNKLFLDGIYYSDIFDVNYDKYRKHLKETKEKKEKSISLERVKSNNLKVSKKLKKHHELMLKILDNREYKPNYSVIEKHKPEVKLGTKSKRLFLKNINTMTAPNIKIFNNRNTKKNIKKDLKINISSYFSKVKNNLSNIKSKEYIFENNGKIRKRIISLSTLNLKIKNNNNNNISTNFDNNNYSLNNKRNKRRHILNICGTSFL